MTAQEYFKRRAQIFKDEQLNFTGKLNALQKLIAQAHSGIAVGDEVQRRGVLYQVTKRTKCSITIEDGRGTTKTVRVNKSGRFPKVSIVWKGAENGS